MIILGISGAVGHDASAAILVDGGDVQRGMLLEMLQDLGCSAEAFSDLGQAYASLTTADAAGKLSE